MLLIYLGNNKLVSVVKDETKTDDKIDAEVTIDINFDQEYRDSKSGNDTLEIDNSITTSSHPTKSKDKVQNFKFNPIDKYIFTPISIRQVFKFIYK